MTNGTEKQIKFANDIKGVFEKGYNLINGKINEEAQMILDGIYSNNDAMFWVDNKNTKEVVGLFKSITNDIADTRDDEYTTKGIDKDAYEEIETLQQNVEDVFGDKYGALRNLGIKLYE